MKVSRLMVLFLALFFSSYAFSSCLQVSHKDLSALCPQGAKMLSCESLPDGFVELACQMDKTILDEDIVFFESRLSWVVHENVMYLQFGQADLDFLNGNRRLMVDQIQLNLDSPAVLSLLLQSVSPIF